MIDKKKLIRVNILGLLWAGSLFAIAKGFSPTFCLLVGMPCGIMFMRETRIK